MCDIGPRFSDSDSVVDLDLTKIPQPGGLCRIGGSSSASSDQALSPPIKSQHTASSP